MMCLLTLMAMYTVDAGIDARERTYKEMLNNMEDAINQGENVHGLKGPSQLINLPAFDIVWGFTPDYMQCILLGVAWQFTDLWLTSTGAEFYIGTPTIASVIDECLLSIKPPIHLFPRLPRSVFERKFWKASEWKTWLLYYSIPCLLGILSNKYLCHFSILVEAVYLLLSDKVSDTQIEKANLLLLEFVHRVEVLYGKCNMTYNVHQLLHIAKSVYLWGPLWAHSAMVFENGNGQLLKYVKASKGVPLQIAERFLLKQATMHLLSNNLISENVREKCCSTLYDKSLMLDNSEEFVQFLGNPCVYNLTFDEQNEFLSRFKFIPRKCMAYLRIKIKNNVYHSEDYKCQKTVSNVAETADKFVKIRKILNVLVDQNEECFLLCTELIQRRNPVICDPHSFACVPHIHQCTEDPNPGLMLIRASELKSIVVYFKLQDKIFVCQLASRYEND